MKTKRQLTEIEQQFVKDAKAGYFGLGYDNNGAPFALGAEDTGNLFSMEVDSAPDGAQWCYFLPENTDLARSFRG
jgi:hypothetical protein